MVTCQTRTTPRDGAKRLPRRLATALSAGLVLSVLAPAADAAENATSFYLLGLHGPFAAVTPPPGAYFQNDGYFYKGGGSASTVLPFNGHLTVSGNAEVFLDLPTLLWSTPLSVAGGRVALSVTEPVGTESFTGRLVTDDFEEYGSGGAADYGDPSLGATLGWNKGRLNWSTTVSVNVPVGHYDPNASANISLHRWAGDVSGALTWLDTATGFETSAVAGITLNGSNQATDYRTGAEFHLEGDVSQYLTKHLSAGLVGYFYQQVTPDSGGGALLGKFEGRAAALGGMVGYDFSVGSEPVSLRLKVFREFAAKNRLTGTAGILSVGIPLYVPSN